jgi:hypothetical protein
MGQNLGVFQHYKQKHYLGDGAPFHTNVKAQKSTIINHTAANRKYPSTPNCAEHTLSIRTSQNGIGNLQINTKKIELSPQYYRAPSAEIDQNKFDLIHSA